MTSSLDLKDVSDSELEKELERRKMERETPPKPLPNPDFSELTKCIILATDLVARGQSPGKDFDNLVCEKAMEAVYGKGFWIWWNKQSRDW